MVNFNKNQIKWLKFIPTGTFFAKTKNQLGGFLQIKNFNTKFELFNWLKLWFFLKYSLIALKNSVSDKFSVLLVSDYITSSKTIITIAKHFNFFFATGPWEGGRLTKTFWYKYAPSFVIIFGVTYPRNFYNELKILGIPSFNLTSHFIFKKKSANNYLIPYFNNQTTSFKNFAAFFSYCIYKLLFVPLLEHFPIKRTFNPFYYQMLRAIQFKTLVFTHKTNAVYQIIFKKKINTFFNLFSAINFNLKKSILFETLRISFYKKWIIKDSKKSIIQSFIKKDKMHVQVIIKQINFITEKKQKELKQQFWLSDFQNFYINEK
jgi:hypothetical protein